MHNTSLAWKTPQSSPVAVMGFDLGKRKYSQGKRLEECNTDAETRGWLAAEANGAQMYMRAMQAAGRPAADALAILDAVTAPGWAHARQDDCKSYDEWRYPNVH